MHPKLLRYYEDELLHLQDCMEWFKKKYEVKARELGINEPYQDPYIDRLLDGFAFLAARIQLKFDSEFPRFTQHLLNSVYPTWCAPLPSAGIVEFEHDPNSQQAYRIGRNAVLTTDVSVGEKSSGPTATCTYRTCQATDIWPVELSDCTYGHLSDLALPPDPARPTCFYFRFRTTMAEGFRVPIIDDGSEHFLDSLRLYINLDTRFVASVWRQLLHSESVTLLRTSSDSCWREVQNAIRPVGFGDGEELLPPVPNVFSGFRLLQEFFALPEKFQFLQFEDLADHLTTSDDELEIVVRTTIEDSGLEEKKTVKWPNESNKKTFVLNAAPIVNLFERSSVRMRVNERETEYRIVFDPGRVDQYEMYLPMRVNGYGAGAAVLQEFLPFHCHPARRFSAPEAAFYSIYRRKSKSAQFVKYRGSDGYLSVVDHHARPMRVSLRQLEVDALCTNRHLPLLVLPGNVWSSNDTLPTVGRINGLALRKPRECPDQDATFWKLIGHLSMNYTSIITPGGDDAAAGLRHLLGLFDDERHFDGTLDAIVDVQARPHVARISGDPNRQNVVARGIELSVISTKDGINGTYMPLLIAVLDQFFSRYVSVNCFVQTVLRDSSYDEVMRWKVRLGDRAIA